MLIILITFISNSLLFFIILLCQNRLPKLRHVKFLEEKKIRSAIFFLGLSILVAGLAWFMATKMWISILASFLALTGISVFFNAMKDWFLKTKSYKVKKEDLLLIGFWLMWLLAGSIFLANIFYAFLNFRF